MKLRITKLSILILLILTSCNDSKKGIEGDNNDNNEIIVTDKEVTIVKDEKPKPLNSTKEVIENFIIWYKAEYLEYAAYDNTRDENGNNADIEFEAEGTFIEDKYDLFSESMFAKFKDHFQPMQRYVLPWIFPGNDNPDNSKDINIKYKLIYESIETGNAEYLLTNNWENDNSERTDGVIFRLELINSKWKIVKTSQQY